MHYLRTNPTVTHACNVQHLSFGGNHEGLPLQCSIFILSKTMTIQQRLSQLNWQSLTESLNQKGYALAANVLTGEECDNLINQYHNEGLYRKTVIMERHNFGQ